MMVLIIILSILFKIKLTWIKKCFLKSSMMAYGNFSTGVAKATNNQQFKAILGSVAEKLLLSKKIKSFFALGTSQ